MVFWRQIDYEEDWCLMTLVEGVDYEIIDNFLNEEEFSFLLDKINSPFFPWFFQVNTVRISSDPNNEEMFYFTHTIVNNTFSNSPHLEDFYNIFQKLGMKAVMRIKINLYPSRPEIVMDGMHIDYEFPHKSAIFFLNTNNGPTVLEDGTKIDAISNRLLKFDASRPHSPSRCTDQKVRLTVNFNYF